MTWPDLVQNPALIRQFLAGGLAAVVILLIGVTVVRLATRRPPWRRLGNPLYLAVVVIALVIFRRFTPELVVPEFLPYFRVLIIFSIVYLTIKLLDVLLVDFIIARTRQFLPPTILRDLVCVATYLGALLILFKVVLGFDLTPILATSAILSVVAGFALQETLANLIAGIVLTVEQPFAVGDWVKVGDKVGQVQEMSWRAIRFRIFEEDDYLIIPNGEIAKQHIINYCQPSLLHGQETTVGVSYSTPPNRVKRVILEVFNDIPGVSRLHLPEVEVKQFGDSAVIYLVQWWIEDYEQHDLIADQVHTGIWYAFRREGIEIPFPIRTTYQTQRTITPEDDARARREELTRITALLRSLDLLATLTPEAQEQLAASVRTRPYEAGKVVIREGEEGDSFFIIAKGRADVAVGASTGVGRSVATLGPGTCFGEMSLLTGARRSATVRVLEDSELLVVDKAAFREILVANPQVAERLSETLSRRQLELEAERAKGPAPGSLQAQAWANQLLGRIRQFFDL